MLRQSPPKLPPRVPAAQAGTVTATESISLASISNAATVLDPGLRLPQTPPRRTSQAFAGEYRYGQNMASPDATPSYEEDNFAELYRVSGFVTREESIVDGQLRGKVTSQSPYAARAARIGEFISPEGQLGPIFARLPASLDDTWVAYEGLTVKRHLIFTDTAPALFTTGMTDCTTIILAYWTGGEYLQSASLVHIGGGDIGTALRTGRFSWSALMEGMAERNRINAYVAMNRACWPNPATASKVMQDHWDMLVSNEVPPMNISFYEGFCDRMAFGIDRDGYWGEVDTEGTEL